MLRCSFSNSLSVKASLKKRKYFEAGLRVYEHCTPCRLAPLPSLAWIYWRHVSTTIYDSQKASHRSRWWLPAPSAPWRLSGRMKAGSPAQSHRMIASGVRGSRLLVELKGIAILYSSDDAFRSQHRPEVNVIFSLLLRSSERVQYFDVIFVWELLFTAVVDTIP